MRPFATDVPPEPGWFTVTASGGPVTVTAAEVSSENPHELHLSLSREFDDDETVTVSYRRPQGSPGLWDTSGNQLANFANLLVENTADTAPSVTAVTVVSDPRDADTYARGEVIRVQVTFSEPVDVTGVPTLTIDMDPAYWGSKQATYVSGTGTRHLVFAHEVVRPNYSTQGIAVIGDSLALAGGLIRSAADGEDAELGHDRLEHDSEHKVDWQLDPPPAEEPAEPGVNRAPTYGGQEAVVLRNALPAILVSLPLSKDDFSDPDGDELTFEMTVDRDDVHVAGGVWYFPVAGRVGYIAKNSCALADLGEPESDAFYTVVTMTATDPDGASTSATATFRTDPAAEPCPTLSSATVDGATVTLEFDADLVRSWVPDEAGTRWQFAEIAADHFEVTVDGTAVSLADTDPVAFDTDDDGNADGDTITLTLADAVTSNQTVTVTYDPGDHPRAAPFEDQAATNNSPPPPGPPKPMKAVVDGSDLILTFSGDLAPVSDAAARNLIFAFLIEGARDSFGTPVSQSPSRVAVDGATITLTLGTPIAAGDGVTITYWGTTLQDNDGTRLPGFTTTLTTTAQN